MPIVKYLVSSRSITSVLLIMVVVEIRSFDTDVGAVEQKRSDVLSVDPNSQAMDKDFANSMGEVVTLLRPSGELDAPFSMTSNTMGSVLGAAHTVQKALVSFVDGTIHLMDKINPTNQPQPLY